MSLDDQIQRERDRQAEVASFAAARDSAWVRDLDSAVSGFIRKMAGVGNPGLQRYSGPRHITGWKIADSLVLTRDGRFFSLTDAYNGKFTAEELKNITPRQFNGFFSKVSSNYDQSREHIEQLMAQAYVDNEEREPLSMPLLLDMAVWFVAVPLVFGLLYYRFNTVRVNAFETIIDLWLPVAIVSWRLHRPYERWAFVGRLVVLAVGALVVFSQIARQFL